MMEKSSSKIPTEWLSSVMNHFKVFPNDTVNFRQPILRKSLKGLYPLFVVLYVLLILSGVISNVLMSVNILKKRMQRNAVYAFLLNVTACNLIMSLLVLPLSLAVLLIQNWVFGQFLCYFIPMLQDIPVHATTLSLVLITLDRFQRIVMPNKFRIPPCLGIVAAWVVAVSVVLPYSMYISYLDVEEHFGSQFAGVGLCAVSLVEDISDYIRGLFIALFVLPLGVITYLYIRTSSEISNKEESYGSMSIGHRNRRESRTSRDSKGDIWTVQDGVIHQAPNSLAPSDLGSSRRYSDIGIRKSLRGVESPSSHLFEDLNIEDERKNQRFIGAIILSFGLCLCPLMILRIVKNMVLETNFNSAHFDLTFIMFVWVAFLPTVTTPIIFFFWHSNKPSKTGVEGYLEFSRREVTYQQPPRRQSQQHEQDRRPSSNYYPPASNQVPHHEELRRLTIGHPSLTAHRLSIEGSLSLQPPHHMPRSLTPNPMNYREPGSSLTPADQYMRPHSLSFSS